MTLDRWLGNDAHSGDRFAQAFGFTPRMTLADGLADECAWYHQIHSNATA
jgi:hypothetical protein